jgi:tetratricopeptide (TPR) repeat protein
MKKQMLLMARTLPLVVLILFSLCIMAGVSGEITDFDKSRLLTKQGISFEKDGKYDQAISAFQTAVNANPSNSDALSGLGSLLFRLGRDREALEVLDIAITVNPRDSEIWYTRGIVLQRMNRISDAEKSFNESLQINPNSSRALRGKGEILILRNNSAEAIAMFEKGISIDPLDGSITAGLGEALFMAKNYTGAENVTAQALLLYPLNLHAWYVRADIAAVLGKEDWARYYNNTAGEIRQYLPTMPDYAKALAFQRLFEYEKALEKYNRAIISYPKAYYVWAGRGEVLRQLGRIEDSFQSYKQAVLLNPNDADLRAELSFVRGMNQ